LFRIEEKEVSILFYSITVTEFVSFFVFQFGSVPVCLCSRSLLVSMVTDYVAHLSLLLLIIILVYLSL